MLQYKVGNKGETSLKKQQILKKLFEYFMMVVSSFVTAIAVYVFVNPNKTVPGGITGVATTICNLFPQWDISTVYLILNAPILVTALIFLRGDYTIKTVVASLGCSFFMGVFENARNKKFVKRAGQVLDEKKIVRIGIVGSYGKTSVKNILQTILSEKYKVVATPLSYNTPIGIAKTVALPEFENAEILIAEMGARKKGDIAELCEIVKPDFAIFTGVCEQHIQTFGSVENVFAEKSEIIKSGAFVVCGENLKARVEEAFEKEYIDEAVAFAGSSQVEAVQFLPTQTKFVLRLGEEKIGVSTRLLGRAAVENIACLGKCCKGIFIQYLCPSVEVVARRVTSCEDVGKVWQMVAWLNLVNHTSLLVEGVILE